MLYTASPFFLMPTPLHEQSLWSIPFAPNNELVNPYPFNPLPPVFLFRVHGAIPYVSFPYNSFVKPIIIVL